MEENKFEKQVQQKMDELQIQPSDVVWKKIGNRIEKKKSNRWGWIILFLSIAFILSCGYWLWTIQEQKSLANNNIVKPISKENKDQKIDNSKNIQSKTDSLSAPIASTNNKAVLIAEKNDNKKSIQQDKFLTNSKANQQINSSPKTSKIFSKNNEIETAINGKAEAEIVSPQSFQEQYVNNNTNIESVDSISQKISRDSLSMPFKAGINRTAKDNDTSKPKQNNTLIVKQTKKSKWKIGILFSGGLSGVGNKFLALSNPPNYLPAGSLNSGQQSTFSYPTVKSGAGYMAGVFMEKSISKNTRLSIGINLKSFHTSIQLNDSSGTYTSRTSANTYINHFNFVEIPASLKIKIANGSMPLFWQSGITFSELIGTNALQYNASVSYYYKDNSIFNKTQIEFNTGLSVTLFSKQKTQLLTGPYFYYDASKIADEGLYNKKHFVFTGLQTQILFGK